MFGSEAKSLIIEKFSTTLKSAGEFIYNFANYFSLPNSSRHDHFSFIIEFLNPSMYVDVYHAFINKNGI